MSTGYVINFPGHGTFTPEGRADDIRDTAAHNRANTTRPSSVSCYAFDAVVARVTHSDKSVTFVTVQGRMWSEYASGPNLSTLANTVAHILGEQNIFVGLASCVRAPRAEEDSAMRAMWTGVQALYDSWYSERTVAEVAK